MDYWKCFRIVVVKLIELYILLGVDVCKLDGLLGKVNEYCVGGERLFGILGVRWGMLIVLLVNGVYFE